MEPKRYWWVLTYSKKQDLYSEYVTDKHPFVENTLIGPEWVIHSWQLISAEEYNLWNELNKK